MGKIAAVIVLALALAASAQAALVITTSEAGLDTFSAATDDLINLGTPSLLGQSNSGGSRYSSDPAGIGLNNGTIYADGSYQATEGGRCYCPGQGSAITFDLDLAAQPAGYTIGLVASTSGGAQARRSQRFRLEASTVGDAAFATLVDENQLHVVSNAGNGEMRVMVYDDTGAPLATGVDQVRVTYFDTGASLPESMYRELDIVANAPAPSRFPQVTSANLAAHFDASNINNDLGTSSPGDGNDVNTWTDLVGGLKLNHNFPTDGKPTFIAAGSGGIGDQDTVRFVATGAGPPTQDDLMFNNAMGFSAQTIYAVTTMADNGDMLATLLCNQYAGLNIRQTVSSSPSYFSGNSADFINSNGVFHINGNPRWDIPGGFGAAHVVKAVRDAAATYDGFRFSDNIRNDRRWNGDIAEVLIFDGKLNGNDSARVNKYLIDKYGINQVIDERLSDTTQVADAPFSDEMARHAAVNFFYSPGGDTAGTLHGIAFDNIALNGSPGPPAGPFALTANGDPIALTLNMPFTSDNTPRTQNVNATGPDATVLNVVAGEMFYIGGNNHATAQMIFSGLWPDTETYVQLLGGDGGWNGDLLVLANNVEAGLWTTVADSSSSNASLFGFFATTDAQGQLAIDLSIAAGNYAGIGGVIVTQHVPEPTTLGLLALGGLALMRRRRDGNAGGRA